MLLSTKDEVLQTKKKNVNLNDASLFDHNFTNQTTETLQYSPHYLWIQGTTARPLKQQLTTKDWKRRSLVRSRASFFFFFLWLHLAQHRKTGKVQQDSFHSTPSGHSHLPPAAFTSSALVAGVLQIPTGWIRRGLSHSWPSRHHGPSLARCKLPSEHCITRQSHWLPLVMTLDAAVSPLDAHIHHHWQCYRATLAPMTRTRKGKHHSFKSKKACVYGGKKLIAICSDYSKYRGKKMEQSLKKRDTEKKGAER